MAKSIILVESQEKFQPPQSYFGDASDDTMSKGEKHNLQDGNGLLERSLRLDSTFDHYFRDLINAKNVKRPLFGLATALALKKINENDVAVLSRTTTQEFCLYVLFRHKDDVHSAQLIRVNGKAPLITNSHAAKAMIFDLKEREFKIDRMSDSTLTTAPPLPLTTAKLLAAAEEQLGFSPRQTSEIARSLYDGCAIGQKRPVELITCPITDSLFVPEKELLAARELILVNYGRDYVPEKPRIYSDAESDSGAIRPTLLSRSPKKLKKHLTETQFLLYDLIWNRFLASQMTDSAMIRRTVDIVAGPQKRYAFRMEQTQTVNRGYLQLFPDAANETSQLLSREWRKNDKLIPHDFVFSARADRSAFYYTEGRLLQALGDSDVCLVETLAYIPDILKEWKFIHQTADGRLYPTQPGKNASELLQQHYPDILNEQFMRQLKKRFILSDKSKKNIDPVAELSKLLQYHIRTSADQTTIVTTEKTNRKCPVCGGAMLRQSGPSGDFMVCEFYPDKCQYSKSIAIHVHRYYGCCDDCHAELTVKVGRYGRFLACSTFPKCKFTKPFPIGAKCPREGCDGDVIERITKTGRLFYGCSHFPSCKFSSWQMPVNIACPKCGNLYMTTKSGDDSVYHCPKCRAEFDMNLVEQS